MRYMTSLVGLAAAATLATAATAATGAAQSAAPDTTPCAPRASAPPPFAFADFTWLNGNPREKDAPLDTKYFSPEFRVDVSYIGDFNHPSDHTLVGSSESGRTEEVQLQQLGIGGDFHVGCVRARLMTQFGMYSTMTPRNDASPGRGQWNLADAYRYLSEAYGGRHFDTLDGINVDAGIFMSYVGLFSYYNYDNWAYQPSYVSSNTPWFFNGIRIQIFTSDHLKIEPWIINGWQSYGMFNEAPGIGAQTLWRPNGSVSVLSNNYYGRDWLGIPGRWRLHSDNSVEVKYSDDPSRLMDREAFSVTGDIGCESGGNTTAGYVSCTSGAPNSASPKQNFLGAMAYNRTWFDHDTFGVTLGGGAMDNPGRYLVLMPPINGATALSGTPYFTENAGNQYKAWDASVTFDYMPDEYTTYRVELNRREASVPYFAGPGGVTPPGGNQGLAGSLVPNWAPDLVKAETRLNFAMLIKF